jgi:dTDP-4-dehydrorhamnose 3,5-epimerase
MAGDILPDSLLAQTLAAASRDRQSVSAEGEQLLPPIEGVSIRRAPTHIDERGSVVEIYDARWNWHKDPVVFAHCFTIRPGYVKGWGLHMHHEDRYFILLGEVEVVLFDPRADSSTYGQIRKITMSHFDRKLINIPSSVWHASINIGDCDVVALDLPTAPYDHRNPDKYRLPIDTPLIPHSFGTAKGW